MNQVEASLNSARQEAKAHEEKNQQLVAEIEQWKQTISKIKENHSEEMEHLQEEMDQMKMNHAMELGIAQSGEE